MNNDDCQLILSSIRDLRKEIRSLHNEPNQLRDLRKEIRTLHSELERVRKEIQNIKTDKVSARLTSLDQRIDSIRQTMLFQLTAQNKALVKTIKSFFSA